MSSDEFKSKIPELQAGPLPPAETSCDPASSLVQDQRSPTASASHGAVEVADVDRFGALFVDGPRSEESELVYSFLKHKEIEILFDGSMRYARASLADATPESTAWDTRPIPTEQWLLDEICHVISRNRLTFKRSDVRRAFERIVGEARQDAKGRVAASLFVELNPDERKLAANQWLLLESVFEKERPLCTAALKHFIWQVKRKLMSLPITDHLMPILISATQGSGKSTLVDTLLAPLNELALQCVLLSDLTDARAGELFRYPVCVIDDMAELDKRKIAVLNSVVTGKQISRRKLGTSSVVTHRQSTTLIGTANKPINELINDDTGNRRFVALPFRNGDEIKGGDPEVWAAINEINALSLWRSVDARGPSPIKEHLASLHRWQEECRSKSEVEIWLENVDVSAPALQVIASTQGLKARPLYEVFKKETGSSLAMTQFGEEMTRLAEARPDLPFDKKGYTRNGTVYPLRPRE